MEKSCLSFGIESPLTLSVGTIDTTQIGMTPRPTSMTRRTIIATILAASTVFGQTAPPAFEVASVKLYKDDGVGDRGLHNSYGLQGVDFRCALALAIGEAYNFPVGRIVGPGSLTKEALWGALSQGYSIVAKSAEPSSRDQLRLMLQSLFVRSIQVDDAPGKPRRLRFTSWSSRRTVQDWRSQKVTATLVCP